MSRRLPLSLDSTPPDRRDGAVTMLREASASMSPVLQAGDHLAVAWARPHPRRGAVVAYFDGRRVVAHRLIARTRTRLILKGDALPDADPPVDPLQYCGEVIAVRRPDGRTLDLTLPRWRLTGRVLAAMSAAPGSPGLRRVLTRAICHIAARCLR